MRRLLLASLLVASVSLAADAFTLGISQPYGPEAAEKVPAVVEPYLSKALGGQVKVLRFETAEALTEALTAGKVDLAWITPLAWVRATQKNPGVTAVVKAMRQGSLVHRTVFITKAGGASGDLKAYKGKRVAFVSKSSTSGYLFPRELLRKEGLSPDGFFGEELFLGDHPAVCKAVREGKADLGATYAEDPKEGAALVPTGCADAPPLKDFAVIASSGNLPNEVIAVRDFFPPKRLNDVTAAFGRMTDSAEGKQALEAFRVDGWWATIEGDFAPVLELLNVKPEPKKAPAPAKKGKK